MAATKIKPEVESWIQDLSDEDMPGFASTVADVTEEINSDETSAVDVAQSVLKDPALTSRLLKMANSLFYNPNTQKISTVSRAVMILGFEQVRALTLSLVLVDSLKEGQQRDMLTAEMARSFHAAIQAQELAHKMGCESPENVFIAALLSRLGHMAFWAFSGDKANQVINLINSSTMTEQQAEKAVLNFSLHELSQGLSKSWSLGELLEETLAGVDSDDLQVNIIQLSHELAEASQQGWESDEVESVVEKIVDRLDLSVEDIAEISHDNAKLAQEITKLYGITEASKQIPQPKIAVSEAYQPPPDLIKSLITEAQSSEADDEISYTEHPEPDSNLQLTILQDIADAIEEKPSINIILEMVLEGLYRGIGMDRSMFAILSKDHKQLSCKYALGANNEQITQDFHIDISQATNIFKQITETKKARHVDADPKHLGGTLSKVTIDLLGTPPYLVMPTIVKGKVIGLFIADRNASGRQIDDKDFIAFQQFCQQANMGLTFLTMQG